MRGVLDSVVEGAMFSARQVAVTANTGVSDGAAATRLGGRGPVGDGGAARPAMSLYLEGARVLAQKHGSLKSRIYGDGSLKSPRPRLYALVVETLKHQELLNDVISASDLLATEKKVCASAPAHLTPLTLAS